MTKLVSTDFDEFADALVGLAGRFIPTARSTVDWCAQTVALRHTTVQLVQTGGAATFVGDGRNGTISIGIPLSAPSCIRVDGHSLGENSFILVREGQPFTAAARQVTRWAGVAVSIEHEWLAPDLLEALRSRAKNQRGTHTQSAISYMAQAKLLISRLCTSDDGGTLETAALRAAEEEILAIAARVLEASSKAEHRRAGRPRYCRDRVVAKALALIEASGGKPLYIHSLCDAARVSERTLRNVFQEHFGVSPMRLLKVRQLCEVRAALLQAEGGRQRVAAIASRFGVWDLTLFGRSYKALFGESPATTLGRPPASRERRTGRASRWLEFALRRFIDGECDNAKGIGPIGRCR